MLEKAHVAHVKVLVKRLDSRMGPKCGHKLSCSLIQILNVIDPISQGYLFSLIALIFKCNKFYSKFKYVCVDLMNYKTMHFRLHNFIFCGSGTNLA